MQEKLKTDLADVLKPIEEYLQRVDVEIIEKMKTGVPIIDSSGSHLFKRGGKKIRASLIILCSSLKGAAPDDVVEIAAAAEIIHAATLIHDDIIDNSVFRRGDVTVSNKWGSKVAVLVGDYLYTRALEVAVSNNRLDLFPIMVEATKNMVKGELYQIEYSQIDVINKEHYFNIIELKTARFLAACAKLGGVKSGYTEEEADALFNFGMNLGYAFQIIDDTLDVMDSAQVTGKDTGNDFINGKITLPVLHLVEQSDGEKKKFLIESLREPDEKKWKEVREMIIASGAVEYCIDISRNYLREGLEFLSIFPDSVYKEVIFGLSQFLLERKY
ncbi:MAG TPA: polyprenyl synthetase family protein [Spirochaetota bacterium]|nr:polyprenyl synthetase family protein [Spirochaetota bacterium]HPJ38063.1 polyprenyl synthetase family protein [Spirochaetota bacterium]HPQ51960.1 polyprenyl synthetase family protein [Spirochaetota bacterium]